MTNIKKSAFCVNCGKILNPKTLVCDACGTDYNDKPKCEHFYTKYFFERDLIKCSVDWCLKCEKCGEVTRFACSENMINDILDRLIRF